jgi:catabolite regulation protein CreA
MVCNIADQINIKQQHKTERNANNIFSMRNTLLTQSISITRIILKQLMQRLPPANKNSSLVGKPNGDISNTKTNGSNKRHLSTIPKNEGKIFVLYY